MSEDNASDRGEVRRNASLDEQRLAFATAKVSSANLLQDTSCSHSFQSSSSSSSSITSTLTVVHQQQSHFQQKMSSSSSASSSGTSSNIGDQKLITIKTSSASGGVTGGSKTKFQSFLQQPELAMHAGYLSATSQQQKFVRQFVRSSSAHNESIDKPAIKCIRSASTQMDESTAQVMAIETAKVFQQKSVLMSKSAETIETTSSSSSTTMGTGIRNTLTLSGGLLAPPNRKFTILSPIHAPPGLQEMLKRHQNRSPCSPRLVLPGTSEMELFG
ncbi:cAMP-specific 3',5'-cyclic phosphodiesterase [Sergentomyia squamirostris]